MALEKLGHGLGQAQKCCKYDKLSAPDGNHIRKKECW
jgi:hypothetical protein